VCSPPALLAPKISGLSARSATAALGASLSASELSIPALGQQVRSKSDAKVDTKKKVQPLSFGIVTKVKDGVAFARDLGFASFGELVIFVPSPARLKAMQKEAGGTNYVDGMIVGLERDLTSVVILGNERLVKVRSHAAGARASPAPPRVPRAHFSDVFAPLSCRSATASSRARVSSP
jgi:hypothetical protein